MSFVEFKEVIEASEKIDTIVHEDPKRWDLRDLQMVTIDGEDAKDLDEWLSSAHVGCECRHSPDRQPHRAARIQWT